LLHRKALSNLNVFLSPEGPSPFPPFIDYLLVGVGDTKSEVSHSCDEPTKRIFSAALSTPPYRRLVAVIFEPFSPPE